jgi:GTP diphosphokinase / guanosine-3',5'-bis(diphosphate) 3'-diphosphatase
LNSGDQVEILTSKSQHVQPSWINFVSTAKARAKIQAILRRDNREIQKNGESVLNAWLTNNSLELTSSVLDKLCDYHDVKRPEDLFLALGDKKIILGEKDLDELLGKVKKEGSNSGWRKYVPFLHDKKSDKDKDEEDEINNLFIVDRGFKKKKPVIISEETINMFIFPACCHPIPGDDILGYIDNKNHIEIHKRACPVASRLKSSYGNRILDAKWDMHKQMYFDATIEIRGIDRKGMLQDVAEVISSRMNLNIHKVTINSDEGIFDGSIEVKVHDRDEVRDIMENLKGIDDLQEVMQIM